MKRTAHIALAIALLMAAAACRKDNKEAQIKALDDAYKSGVFTREEYEAKRQALIGPPAAAPITAPAAPAPASPAAAPPPTAPPVETPPAAAASPQAAAAPPPSYTPPPSAPAPAPARQAAPPSAPAPAPAPARQPAAPPPSNTPPVATPQPSYTPPVATPPPTPTPAPPPPPQQAAQQQAEPEPAPLAGCQDAESRAGGRNGVQERFFIASEDAVRQAALQAFANLDFTIHNSSPHDLEASKKRHLSVVLGAGGEKVFLHFAPARQNGQMGTRVTAETKKTLTGRLAQKSWTTAVLAQIGCNLRGGR